MLSIGSPKHRQVSPSQIDQIFAVGQLSRQDHLQLMSLLLSSHHLDVLERQRINQVFDAIQTGKLRIVDSPRPSSS